MKRLLSVILIFILFIVFIFNILTPIASAQCQESWTLANKLIDSGMVIQVRNGFREWLVSKQWYSLTLPVKEQAVQTFAMIRKKCDGYISIKIRDAYTGKTLVKNGSFGVKINN